MSDITDVKKYIFKQRLAGERICIVYSVQNGFYADLLEQCEIWELESPNPHKVTQLQWLTKYPLSIKYNENRHDLEVGDSFSLAL